MKELAALLLTTGLAFAGSTEAAPVARTADLTLTISILGLVPLTLSATGATVMVDDSGGLGGQGQITIPAGAITAPGGTTLPVTATTAIASLTVETIGNLTGVFSYGGAGANIPTTELPCPALSAGIACVQQTGLGGVMGLSGVISLPGFVPVPVASFPRDRLGQGGRATTAGGLISVDAAPWTVKTVSVAFTTTTTTVVSTATPGGVVVPTTVTQTFAITVTQMGTSSVTTSGTRITLISPSYIAAVGNQLPAFSTLEIHFVPEPGAPWLVGTALAGLVVVARSRRA